MLVTVWFNILLYRYGTTVEITRQQKLSDLVLQYYDKQKEECENTENLVEGNQPLKISYRGRISLVTNWCS